MSTTLIHEYVISTLDGKAIRGWSDLTMDDLLDESRSGGWLYLDGNVGPALLQFQHVTAIVKVGEFEES